MAFKLVKKIHLQMKGGGYTINVLKAVDSSTNLSNIVNNIMDYETEDIDEDKLAFYPIPYHKCP